MTSPFGGDELLDPLPLLRLDITNNSEVIKHFGFGTDFTAQGEIDQLWRPETWGAFAEVTEDFRDTFWVTLQPSESLSSHEGGASTWGGPLPAWSGHSLRVFGLSEPPIDGAEPTAVTIATLVVPGRFVAANLEDADLEDLSAIIGQGLTVDGGGGSPALFPGVSASVSASGLTPGEDLELWIAPNLDYFFFALYGGGLPANAVYIGSDTVADDGTLLADFTLPSDTLSAVISWSPVCARSATGRRAVGTDSRSPQRRVPSLRPRCRGARSADTRADSGHSVISRRLDGRDHRSTDLDGTRRRRIPAHQLSTALLPSEHRRALRRLGHRVHQI